MLKETGEYTIREYTQEDIPALTDLWVDVFKDKREFVEEFFRLLPNMGSCLLMEDKTGICAEASVITGFDILSPGVAEGPIVGYIYACCVRADLRGKGYGTEICTAACELALEREADIVCTLPSDEGLYSFYSNVLNFDCALRRKLIEVAASPSEMTMKLTATEYSMFRSSMLSGRSFLHPSFFTMEFVKSLCETYGGGLYASESGICTAQVEGEACVIHELICRDEAAAPRIAASVAHTLGCSRAEFYLPSTDGEPYIAAEKGKISPDTFWGTAFE